MSEILTALGLTGEVTQVTISDTGLFSASNETGEWIVTAHQAFSTDEWMKVTINEIEYTIAVTDDQGITPWAVLQAALNAGGSNPVILAQNITAGTDDSCLEVPSGVTVTLDLNGHTIDRGLTGEGKTAQDNGNVITVKGNLTVQDTSTNQTGKITGGNTNSNSGGVYVNGGTFKMTGGTISGNKANNGKGGGVYVDSGAFTMSGGTISGNTAAIGGGGVYMTGSNSTFDMSGGKIGGTTETEKNTAAMGGGGVYVHGGTFTMSGNGTISGNSAINDGGGVYVHGGTFTMEDGTISGNTADDRGGGVFVYSGGKFTMSGNGTISGNTADDSGGGVYVDSGAFTMSGGTISGNTAAIGGGGVYVHGGTFTMSGNGTISGNNASFYGGGVYVDSGNNGSSGTFNMTGGTISGNTATYGGGVYMAGNFCTFTMSGNGTISGNIASNNGGGVYVSGGTFSLSGKPTVTGNTGGNVYLPEGRTIAVTDTLSGACIGVTAQARPEDAGLVTLTGGLRGRGEPSAFISDEGYAVGWNDAGTEAALGRKIAHAARGYEGVCDGAGHGITVTVTEPASGYAVRYGTSEGNYSLDKCPAYSDAGTYTVYYRVTANGYFPATGSAKVTLTPAPAPEPERKPEIVIKGDYTLLTTAATVTNTSINLGWTALDGAEGYDVFVTKCGRRSVYKVVASVPADAHNDCNITGLKKGTPYKAYVMAWRMENGQKVYLGNASPTVHAIAGGSNDKFCNAKGVSVRKTALTVKVGKKRKIKASVKGTVKGKKVLKHARKLRYYSSDRSIATVDRKGRVKGVAPGTCTVFVVANNGASKAVTVTVN